ncbi:MAG: tetratricopeptide repeat protein [Flavobacteriales bacterium]
MANLFYPSPAPLIPLTGPGSSGQSGRDSLLGVWNDEAKADTTRLKALHSMAIGLLNKKPKAARKWGRKGIGLAEKKGVTRYQGGFLTLIGNSFYYQSRYDSALHAYRKGLEVYRHKADTSISSVKKRVGLHFEQHSPHPKSAR